MANEKDSEQSKTKGDPDSGGSSKSQTVPPDLMKDIKGKNTTRDKIDPSERFL